MGGIAGDPLRAGIEKGFGGLVGPQVLGDEDLLEIGIESGAGESAVLDRGGAVAGQEEPVAPPEGVQSLLGPGEKVVADAQVMLVALGHLFGVCRDPHFLEQDLKTPGQYLVPGDLPPLQHFPVLPVDDVIPVQDGLCGGQTEGAEGFGNGQPLRLVEVQNGIVQV